MVTTIAVNCGDVISFRASRGNSTTWMLYEQPFVDVISNVGPEKPVTTVTSTFSDNFPYYVGNQTEFPYNSTVLFKGNWSWIAHSVNDYSIATLVDTIRRGNHNPADDPWGDPFVEPEAATGLGASGYPVIRVGGWNGWWGNTGAFAVYTGYTTGLRYIAEYDGKISIDITKLGAGTAADTLYAVFVNGQMVWPNVGDYYTDNSKWHDPDVTPGEATTLTNVSSVEATGIFVNAGDAVELLIKSPTTTSRHNEVDMKVIYNTIYGGDTLLVSIEDAATHVETKTEYKNGDKLDLPTYDIVPDDFLGWDANGDGAVDYEMGETVTVETNLKLVPVFKEYEKYTELVFKGTNWPTSHDDTSIASGTPGSFVLDSDFAGGWAAVGYNYGAITTMPFDSKWNSYGSWGAGILWPASIDGNFARTDLADVENQGVGYTYTVPYTGVIRLETSFTTPVAKAFENGGCDAVYFSILKLAADGTATTVVDTIEYTDTTLKTNAAKHVEVNAGDTILYLYRVKTSRSGANNGVGFVANFNAVVYYESNIDPDNTVFVTYKHPATGRDVMLDAVKGESFTLPEFPAGYVFYGWDLNNDGVVDGKPGSTIEVGDTSVEIKPVLAATSEFHKNLPVYDALDSHVNYYGGWQVGAYDKVGDKFLPLIDYIEQYKLFCNYNNAWIDFGGFYVDGNPRFAMSQGSLTDGPFWSQIQYTTPMAGAISIDLLKLEGTENGNPPDPLAFKIAIYKNGEKIWPAGDEWAYVEKDANGDLLSILKTQYPDAFPLSVNVNVGDTIEFRAEKQNAASYMLALNPAITYTALNTAPKVTATSVSVKDTFTLNIYTILNSVRTDFVATGLKIWTSLADAEAMNENYSNPAATIYNNNTAEGALVTDVTAMYSIKNIAAQNMSKTFYIRTWVEYADGIVYGDVIEVSVEQYAKNAANAYRENNALKRVATALLQYNIAVNEYYGIQSDLVLPEDLPVMPEVTPEDSFNMTEFEGNPITGATLNITDKINIVVYVETDKNISGWRMWVDDNAAFTTPKKCKLVKIDERFGGGYYVTVEVNLSDYQDEFYFKIVDALGEEQSGVLTYSVESYVARKIEQDPDNEKLIALLKSMLVLCKTAKDLR
ncbi:MAG: hypothetical protein IJY20_00810 [Clostridia bacterium]|nr:hypothetical protein [Clostridia bacterium]